MAMTEQELLERIATLSGQEPSADKYTLKSSVSKGSGKKTSATTSEKIDRESLEKDRASFWSGPVGQEIGSLRGELQRRRDYSNSLLGQTAGGLSYLGEIPGAAAGAALFPSGEMAPPGTTRMGRAATIAPGVARGIAPALMALMALHEAQDPHNTPMTQDVARVAGTTLGGFASYPAAMGLYNAMGTVGRPAPQALTPAHPEMPQSAPPPVRSMESPITSGMENRSAVEQFAEHVGLKTNQPKKTLYPQVRAAALNSDEATIRGLAEGAGVKGALTEPIADVRRAFMDALDTAGKTSGRWKILAMLAGGAGAAALNPEGAKAAARHAYEAVTERPGETAAAAGEAGLDALKQVPGTVLHDFAANMPGTAGGEMGQSPEEFAASERAQQEVEAARGAAYARLAAQGHGTAGKFEDALNDFKEHVGKIKARQQPQAPGMQPPPGPSNFASMPRPDYGMPDSPISPGTSAFLQSMMAGRNQSNALALLMRGQSQ